MSMNAPRLTLALVACVLLGSTTSHAAECRKTSSVDKSATSLQANTDAGGHVSIHVMGQKTEAGKSQFLSEADFLSAWGAWSGYSGPKGPDPKTCGSSSSTIMDCVPADLVGMGGKNKGYVCDAVDSNGKCLKGHYITPVKVAFRYAKNSKGVWILNTAYPSLNDSCQ